jgi:FkbM family methyltransferase
MIKLYNFYLTFDFIIKLIKSLLYNKFWNIEEKRNMKYVLKDCHNVLDIGANIGDVSKEIFYLNKKINIISFEPGLFSRIILRIRVYINNLYNVSIIPFALSDKIGYSFLYVPEKRKNLLGIGLAHLETPYEYFSKRKFNILRDYVHVSTIDQVVSDLKLESVDFIKIDVEGFELKVLKGGVNVLKKFNPTLCIEIDDKTLLRAGDKAINIYNFLNDFNYQSYKIINGKFEKVNNGTNGDQVFFFTKDNFKKILKNIS